MTTDFEQRARDQHETLPGIVRATLIDHGVSTQVIDERLLGFDGEDITIPVRNEHGSIIFFERWSGWAIGVPADSGLPVALYGADRLEQRPYRVIVAEGILEALALESQGFNAIAATGSGRFFKAREWGQLLRNVPDVVLAYKRGERSDRRRGIPSRQRVLSMALSALPRASVLWWPEEVGDNGGAFEFFVKHRHSADDLEDLSHRSP